MELVNFFNISKYDIPLTAQRLRYVFAHKLLHVVVNNIVQ